MIYPLTSRAFIQRLLTKAAACIDSEVCKRTLCSVSQFDEWFKADWKTIWAKLQDSESKAILYEQVAKRRWYYSRHLPLLLEMVRLMNDKCAADSGS